AASPRLERRVALTAIATHEACPAAINSSGLVTPSASPMRRGKLTGRLNAPLPAFAVPLPSIIGPSQFTVTLRENVAIKRLRSFLFACHHQLHDHADGAERQPREQHPGLPR